MTEQEKDALKGLLASTGICFYRLKIRYSKLDSETYSETDTYNAFKAIEANLRAIEKTLNLD